MNRDPNHPSGERALPLELKIFTQAKAVRKPEHWSLVLSREGQEENSGTFHVKGDAIGMRYRHNVTSQNF